MILDIKSGFSLKHYNKKLLVHQIWKNKREKVKLHRDCTTEISRSLARLFTFWRPIYPSTKFSFSAVYYAIPYRQYGVKTFLEMHLNLCSQLLVHQIVPKISILDKSK